jgi:hypothetical protein
MKINIIMLITIILKIIVQTIDAKGGPSRMWNLYGSEMEMIIN